MPWQPPRRRRKKVLALVAGLHLALGALLLTGLAGQPPLERALELAAFDLPASPTLTPDPPPPDEQAPAARERAGAADLSARPAAVVLPPPTPPAPSPNPLATSDERAPVTGSAPSAGAGAEAGPGAGAGGEGDGTGGGGSGGLGSGNGSGLSSEARLLSGNLTRGDYRRIRSFGSPGGQAVLAIEVGPAGRLSSCLPLSGSGNPSLDSELCRLLGRTRWEPARDGSGRPVAVSLRYVATWERN